jgi:7-keto-8-aminopelargonate synthetase-like enzyme
VDLLDAMLGKIRATSPSARILVISESVFSMDGDRAPLAVLIETTDRHEALLLLDEAHATGVFGPQGRGLSAATATGARVDFQMGTLSKALGCHGGFVAARRPWIDLIYNRARSFLFATAPPASVAAAATTALELCLSPEGDRRRRLLEANFLGLADALRPPTPPASPIVPVVIGAASAALELSSSLAEVGILAPAIRFPTVAKDSARLRFTATADHCEADIATLKSAWDRLARA